MKMISNKIKITILFIAVLLSPLAAFGGYGKLKREFKNYNPPIPVESSKKKPNSDIRSEPEKLKEQAEEVVSGESAREFEEQKQKLEQIKADWQHALKEHKKAGMFYRPDQKVLEQLRPAGSDNSAAAGYLYGRFSLDWLLTLVFLRNSDIDASRKRARAAVEAFSQVANLDSILRQYTAFTEDLMPGVGPMKGKEPVSMRFPFPGVMALDRKSVV